MSIFFGKGIKQAAMAVVLGLGVSTMATAYATGTPMVVSAAKKKGYSRKEIAFDSTWQYGANAKINTGKAILYRQKDKTASHLTVCVNAGHGTKGGESVKTLCHPDGSPKVTGGTTASGAREAIAVSSGTTMKDGISEASANLAMAQALKDELLRRGYDVLMIRETDDVALDNVARTVMANKYADCHLAIHYDSTTSDKGAFYCSVPDVASYRNMEPVKSCWEMHTRLGTSLIDGMRGAGVKIFGKGTLPTDLTQTSYSTIASVDVEIGDRATDHSAAMIDKTVKGLADGIDVFFTRSRQ